MKLEKYPVTTERGTYRVTVSRTNLSLIGPTNEAEVYVKGKSKILNRDKWVCVTRYIPELEIGIDAKDFTGHYVELAKLAVNKYEDYLRKQEDRERRKSEGLQDWNAWDGRISE